MLYTPNDDETMYLVEWYLILSANLIKCSNTLKQFDNFVGLALKALQYGKMREYGFSLTHENYSRQIRVSKFPYSCIFYAVYCH